MEFFSNLPGVLEPTFFILYLLYPILLPVLLVFGFVNTWIAFRRARFIEGTDTVLLEIKVPRDVPQTPQAMELVVNSLYQTGGESTWYDRYILGKVRSWFSLEIVSLGGDIRFFIWTHAKWRNLIESQLYAEYPGVEVFEVPDYVTRMPFDESKYSYWGGEFIFAKDDYIPLRTYIDYGMDKQVGRDPEDRLDPLLPTIEYFGTLRRGEQAWMQIVVRAHKGRRPPGSLKFWEREKWQDRGKEFIKETTKNTRITAEGSFDMGLMSESEKIVVQAVARNVSKYGLDTGIRLMYMGENDVFNGANIPGFVGAYKQFGANDLNALKPSNVTDFDYPWDKALRKKELSEMKRKMLDAYRRRQFYHSPYIRKHSVMNPEQIATLFHFPSGIVETPAFGRIQSRKAEPPTNLPSEPADGNDRRE